MILDLGILVIKMRFESLSKDFRGNMWWKYYDIFEQVALSVSLREAKGQG